MAGKARKAIIMVMAAATLGLAAGPATASTIDATPAIIQQTIRQTTEDAAWDKLTATLTITIQPQDGTPARTRTIPLPLDTATRNVTIPADTTDGIHTFAGADGDGRHDAEITIGHLPEGWTATTAWSKDGTTQDTDDGADTETITINDPAGNSRTYTFTFHDPAEREDGTTRPEKPDRPTPTETGRPAAQEPAGPTVTGTMPTDPQVEQPDPTTTPPATPARLADTGIETTFGPIALTMLATGTIAAIAAHCARNGREPDGEEPRQAEPQEGNQ